MNTDEKNVKDAEFPTKYGKVEKTVPKTPILALTDDMSETTIQLRLAGYREGLYKDASKKVNDETYRISKLVKRVDEERHEKFLAAGDVRQRALTEAHKTHQEELRDVQSNHAARIAEIERHHDTAKTTARITAGKRTDPLNAEMEAFVRKSNADLAESINAALAEMTPAMEKAKAKRLAAEAERKAKAERLAANADVDALAAATDEELAAAAAVEARTS